MKTSISFTTRQLVIASVVALAPAGSALAAPDCTGDPFAAYGTAFRADGAGYRCGASVAQPSGAQGPAGIVMTSGAVGCSADPLYRVRQVLRGEGPADECVVWMPAPARRSGFGATQARHPADDPFARYAAVFNAD